MSHTYLTLAQEETIERLVLLQKDNNLDGEDNLDTLPAEPAVYAICGRVNGQPANCRYVGTTQNLRQSIQGHFNAAEPHECLRNFMQSIKIKELVYQPLPDATREELAGKEAEWKNLHKPECNEKLNEVY